MRVTTTPDRDRTEPGPDLPYETPALVPIGDLRDLLAKSGRFRDVPGPNPRRPRTLPG